MKPKRDAIASYDEQMWQLQEHKRFNKVNELKAQRHVVLKMRDIYRIFAALTMILSIPFFVMGMFIYGLLVMIILYFQITWIDTETIKAELLNIRIKQYKGDENESLW